MRKIAVIADSGSDINLPNNENLFVLPLRIIIDGKEFVDKKDITLDEVLAKLDTSKVTTSLPSPEDILNTLDLIKEKGFTDVIAIPISKGLSGTMNIINQVADSYEGLNIVTIDTKNISMASGYSSLEALELIKEGKSFDEVVKIVNENLEKKKVFFTVDNLVYLKRGGRIGLVSATIASILKIKPVISCNDNGIYYTVKKTRGYKHAIKNLFELAKDFLGTAKAYDVTLLNSNTKENIKELEKQIKELMPNIRKFSITKITPSLGIHVGPEALGMAVSIV
ncbi:DegV family protein [Haploplasma axanthum]|uniref:EDD domain-containing protein, DegV family n=1 Tax=Haploplasma axanthum TaxID=29552 RepID=A0A449BC46_HAPAX|nr:DegV family protein [Haploplasma axanthum]VEU80008.1 EDD domain-containing protein, DegV family [Haploplasma axanthum]